MLGPYHSQDPVPAPQTPTHEAPYLIPDLPRAMGAGGPPAPWSQQFPQVPNAGWPPANGASTGYQDSPMGEAMIQLPVARVKHVFQT